MYIYIVAIQVHERIYNRQKMPERTSRAGMNADHRCEIFRYNIYRLKSSKISKPLHQKSSKISKFLHQNPQKSPNFFTKILKNLQISPPKSSKISKLLHQNLQTSPNFSTKILKNLQISPPKSSKISKLLHQNPQKSPILSPKNLQNSPPKSSKFPNFSTKILQKILNFSTKILKHLQTSPAKSSKISKFLQNPQKFLNFSTKIQPKKKQNVPPKSISGTADAGDAAVDQIGHGCGGTDHHAAQTRLDGGEPGLAMKVMGKSSENLGKSGKIWGKSGENFEENLRKNLETHNLRKGICGELTGHENWK